jgi:transmembrane sensor
MPHNEISPREAAANEWIILQRDPKFARWDEFMAWLEESPANADLYAELAALDERLSDLPMTASAVADQPPALVSAANDDTPHTSALSRRWFGAAMAAALIAAIAIPTLPHLLHPEVRLIQTAAGQQESVTLPDGSRIDINGGSVVELIENRPRFARLTSGEAMFHIVHQADKPFIVETTGARIMDLGTAFNVRREDGETSVAVSEGVVVFNPDSDNVKMRAGQGLTAADDRKSRPRAKAVDIASVGGWRDGLLVYNGVALSQVAADLHRTTGMEVSVSVDAADISFRGALTLNADGQRTIDDLAALSGTRALPQGRGWMLSR